MKPSQVGRTGQPDEDRQQDGPCAGAQGLPEPVEEEDDEEKQDQDEADEDVQHLCAPLSVAGRVSHRHTVPPRKESTVTCRTIFNLIEGGTWGTGKDRPMKADGRTQMQLTAHASPQRENLQETPGRDGII
jgi:hypothetical protein